MSVTRRHRRRRRHDVRRVVLVAIGGLLGVGALVGAHAFTLVRDELRNDECEAVVLPKNTRVFDRGQKLLATIAAENNREPVPLSRLPRHLVDATVAIEDKKFWDHNGIDYDRIISAAIRDVGSDGARQGGSTITMQLMKNLCHPNEPRTVSLKLVEAYLAKDFERRYSKQVIMQQYLNGVFYGNNAIGIQAAAITYFNRDAAKLTLAQSALLAGLPQAPSAYNPFRNPDDAIARRNLVLDEMLEDGYIDAAQAAKAKAAPLRLNRGNAFGLKREGYFVDYVEGLLRASLGEKKVKEGGYRVYTTINPKLQQAARRAMQNVLSRYGSDPPSAALVMIDLKGRILTMASSGGYRADSQFNVAGPDAKRQAGSTFKTFVLTTAIAQGVSPNTRYFSKSPLPYRGPECDPPAPRGYAPETYSRSGGGMMSIAQATVRSDNSVFSQMTCDLGPQAVYDMARSMGITSMVPGVDNFNLSLGLGGLNQGVNVLEMARAYAPLANGGYRVKLLPMTKLVRADGKVTQFTPQLTPIFPDGVSAEVTTILRNNVLGGTGGRANLPNVPVAGKTGTVDDFTDAWFVGYTPKYVTAVWVGYPGQKRVMPGVSGGSLPAQIWHDFMVVATEGQSGQSFPAASEPVEFQPFSSYWTKAASSLAAEEKRKEEEEKKKKEEEEKKKQEEEEQQNQPPPDPTAPPSGDPTAPPPPPPTGGTEPPAP
jgi:penicillin-binding protein 1A